MSALRALAEAAGIVPRWENYRREQQEVSDDSLRTVLAALGFPAATEADVAQSRAALAEARGDLPPLVTAALGEAVRLPVRPGRGELVLEDGARRSVALEAHGDGATFGGVDAPGYHRLEVAGRQTILAVAPRHGQTVEGMGRPWALAVQLYALRRPGDGGLGDFEALRQLTGPAARRGADGIAISPVHAQFSADPDRHSPYSPSSRINLNVLHAAIDLPRDADVDALELIDWPTASRRRLAALRAEFAQIGPAERAALAAFRAGAGDALETHARFEALHAEQFGKHRRWHWRTWPEALRHPQSQAVAAFAREHADEVALHAYMQWRADRDLGAAQAAARDAGMRIGLIADLAVGADSGGSHCWSRQDQILGGLTIGAPPDLLNGRGQNWGLAAFSPTGLHAHGFGAFLEMLRAAMRHAGGVRIDHALGLRRLWVVPEGHDSRDGAYLAFPHADLLRLVALESCRNRGDRHRRGPRHHPAGVPGGDGRGRRVRHARAVVRALASALHRRAPLDAVRRGDDQHARPADPGRLVARPRSRMARQARPRRRPARPGAGGARAVRRPLRAVGDDVRERRRGGRSARQRGAGSVRRRGDPIRGRRRLRPGDRSDRGCARPGRAAEPAGHNARAAPELAPPPPICRGGVAGGARGGREACRHLRGARPMKPISATARLQFHQDFTLADATKLVPYFDQLGISHLYASPLLKARAGSTHGYDIVNHNEINPELGGEDALRTMVAALRERGMGLILDIVPNHMGVGGDDNAWWLDVLEWGRASPYAEYFDIDWDPPDPTLRGRMLAPFLGSAYGECLQAGELALKFDEADGRLYVAYHSHRFPITPRDYASVLLTVGGPLEAPARAFADLAPGGRAAVRQAARAAREELLQPTYAAAIAEALLAYSAATPEGLERLHRLLERQNYRLSWWRAATDEINWRRFFDVNGLAGVRQEVPQVFEDTHRTVFRLYAEGAIDGVRIDHVDGLAYPREYCRKLRRRLDTLQQERPPGLRGQRAIIWIEKILAPHERVAADWLTDGATGYDFMSDVAAVLHDPAGEAPLTELWTSNTGRPGDFEVEAQAARRHILRESLSSELFNTATALHRIARRNLLTRDYTLTGIRNTLVELLVHFRTYRIYAGAAGIGEVDQRQMDWAMAGARRTVRTADLPLLELIGDWLSGKGMRGAKAGTARQEWQRAMVKFQQLSAPTAAKSVEDTAFYRYGRLLSRNEVGSEPSQFAISPAAFHAINRERQRRLPLALLATATHDHKRGEDTRIRLAVLSEIPADWQNALQRWTRLNASLKRDLDGPAPDGADELMLYQTLVAAWPLGLAADDAQGLKAFGDRVGGWLEKALREAKRHSGWAVPNTDYEAACHAFLAACLDPGRPVCGEIGAFAHRIALPGAVNGLTQAVLRLTCPGIPDLYQGAEFWDFSLVDPDNRRPVDFAARERALAANEDPASLLAHWRDGRVKQAIIARALAFRARTPGLFTSGAYAPLALDGPAADHLLAFSRIHEGRAAIVLAMRLAATIELVDGVPFAHAAYWRETKVAMPRNLGGRRLLSVFGKAPDTVIGARLEVGRILYDLPVALLEVR